MKYLSVCSGIEAASVAWEPLGWEPVGFAEIEPFPCAVLAEHFPDTPNFGDMTKYAEWGLKPGSIDVIIGGTPCQSFSLAGLRKGIEDPRGNLALVYMGLVDKYQPQWVVWENVPGVLSSSGGRDFGSIVSALVELGYGVAWRVLDAQYFGVAQRRRRVFLIGYRGEWQKAAAVLFESEGCSRIYPTRKQAQEKATTDFLQGIESSEAVSIKTQNTQSNGVGVQVGVMPTLDSTGPCAVVLPIGLQDTAHTLTACYRSSEDGCGRGVPLVTQYGSAEIAAPITASYDGGEDGTGRRSLIIEETQKEANICVAPLNLQNVIRQDESDKRTGLGIGDIGDPAFTLQAGHHHGVIIAPVQLGADVAHCIRSSGTGTARIGDQTGQDNIIAVMAHGQANAEVSITGLGPALTCNHEAPIVALTNTNAPQAMGCNPGVVQSHRVRRLTPMECERLQGFPDNWTGISIKGRVAPDGPRYKALGNSMAVPVIRWIGERIQMVNAIISEV